MRKEKRKYQKKISGQLIEHKDFLIKRLREEWDCLQKEARREQLVRQVKEVGQQAMAVTAKTILVLAAMGGILTIAVIAPNVFGATGRLIKRKNNFFNKKDFNKTKHYLKRQNYIRIKENKKNDDSFEIEITDKGMARVFKTTFDELKIVNKNWDGFWRIVIFDIPNRHKWAREGFRWKLKEIGFYLLQESVFISPYPCEIEVQFLASVFNLTDYVRLIKTQNINPDDDIKKHFNLK